MDLKDVLSNLEGNPELARCLEASWRAGANPEEIAGILGGAGVDAKAGDVEDVLRAFQAGKVKELGLQDIDNDALARIAGGGTGNSCSNADDCDKHFNECSNGFLDNGSRCAYLDYCDETVGHGWTDCLKYNQGAKQCSNAFLAH